MKIEQGTCVWINESGAMKLRVFTIIARKESKVKIDFGNNEVLIVQQKNIRANRMVIFNINGRIIVQNPDKWKEIDFKKYNIKELRFNLQNMAIQEGRAAIHRWTLPLDKLAKLSPLIKLLLICIVVGVIGWASLKFGTYVLDAVMKSRLLECSQVLPTVSEIPIGVITNSTPIG
jgi:hypothetical protein